MARPQDAQLHTAFRTAVSRTLHAQRNPQRLLSRLSVQADLDRGQCDPLRLTQARQELLGGEDRSIARQKKHLARNVMLGLATKDVDERGNRGGEVKAAAPPAGAGRRPFPLVDAHRGARLMNVGRRRARPSPDRAVEGRPLAGATKASGWIGVAGAREPLRPRKTDVPYSARVLRRAVAALAAVLQPSTAELKHGMGTLDRTFGLTRRRGTARRARGRSRCA